MCFVGLSKIHYGGWCGATLVEKWWWDGASVPMYLWSPLFLAHLGHLLKTHETPSLSPLVLERN